jgi:hypothetical protein
MPVAKDLPITRSAPRLLVLLALTALLLAAVGGFAGSASAAPDVQIGIEQNGGMADAASRTQILDAQHGLGAQVIRFQLRYDQVAKCDPQTRAAATPVTSPANTCYDFSVPDAVVQGANQRGMDVILSIFGVPSWEFGQRESWTGGTDAQFNAFSSDYADFAQAAATRYDGRHGMPRVGRWTIWNEPNGGYFFEPRFDSNKHLIGPQRYARMYDAASRRIKLVDPALQVAVGPTAPMPRDLPPLTWARAALPVLQQLGSPIDAWAHNAYMGNQAPFNTTLQDPVVGLGNIADLTKLIDQFPVTSGKPVWITEFAYQTPPAAQSSVSPADQSRLLGEAAYFAFRQPRIKTLIWYSLSDDGGAENPGAFQAGLYYQAFRCGQKICPKPSARNFQHTIHVGTPSNGKVFVWGQARLQPDKTRIFVKRGAGAWAAFANRDTATTGTAALTLKVTKGMVVMVCDLTCGEQHAITGGVTVQGGGVGKGTKRVLPLIKLRMGASLAHGIKYTVACIKCKASAMVLAKGSASKIPAAKLKAVVVARAKVTRAGTRARILLRFTPATQRTLRRTRTSRLTIRTQVKDAQGHTTVYVQPLLLVR